MIARSQKQHGFDLFKHEQISKVASPKSTLLPNRCSSGQFCSAPPSTAWPLVVHRSPFRVVRQKNAFLEPGSRTMARRVFLPIRTHSLTYKVGRRAFFAPGDHCAHARASLTQQFSNWTVVSLIGVVIQPSLCRITSGRCYRKR